MTELQCRRCASLKFSKDYYMNVDCESKELFEANRKLWGTGADLFADSLLKNEICPYFEEQ